MTPEDTVTPPLPIGAQLSRRYHRGVPPTKSTRRAAGWVPSQHGAWAMLAIPYLAGLILRSRDDGLPSYLIPLAGFWVVGYLAFYAASCWLKAPPTRRAGQRPPALTYLGGAALLGLVTIAFAGPGIAWWSLAFLPLLAGALWLAGRRRERALLGGGLTVAAASLMTLVVRFTTPFDLLDAWGSPPATTAVIVAAGVFGYLFGTVLYVKTMIRQRGVVAWQIASVGWHAAWTLLTAGLVWTGQLGWGWPVFFGATTLRAWLMPRLARRRPVSPKQVGLTEVGFSALLILVVAMG